MENNNDNKKKEKDNSIFQGDGPMQKARIIKDGELTTLVKQGDTIVVLKGHF